MTTTQPTEDSEMLETARQAMVRYWTYGVDANGYPPIEDLFSPDALNIFTGTIQDAGPKNMGCHQIVTSVNPVPPESYDRRFAFDVDIKQVCPPGVTAATLYEGQPIGALTSVRHYAVVLGQKPGGGWWVVEHNYPELLPT